MQSVAWAGMIVTRSHSASLSTAIRTTFDGQHPCTLCKVVVAGTAAEQREPSTDPAPRLDLCAAVSVEISIRAPVLEPLVRVEAPVFSRGPDSPVPPPPCC